MDNLKSKSVAYLNWPRESAPEKGMEMGIQTQDIPVWLMCKEDSMQFSFMKARFHPGTDPSNAQLIIICPLCGKTTNQQLRISGAKKEDGSKKTIQYYVLPEPMPVPISDCPEDAVQSVVLSVVEVLGCPTCGRRFKITENVLHKA